MSDAIIIDPVFFKSGDVEILFTSPEYFPDFLLCPDEWEIGSETHIIIGRVSIVGTLEANLAKIVRNLQLDHWSPHKEAKQFLNRNNIPHRSIEWGDIIKRGPRGYFVDRSGFTLIGDGILSNIDFKHIFLTNLPHLPHINL